MGDAHTPTTEPTDFVFDFKITVRATEGETEDEVYRWLVSRLCEIRDVTNVEG